jgi:hypothetical protein
MFQSTRPYGARRVQHRIYREESEFQSTRPYGARLYTTFAQQYSADFELRRELLPFEDNCWLLRDELSC